MGLEAYYFSFSIITFMAAVFHASNMVYFRWKKRDLIGNVYHPNTTEYRTMSKISNTKNLILATIVLVAIAINLVYAIHEVLKLSDGRSIVVPLVIVPALSLGIAAVSIHQSRIKFGNRFFGDSGTERRKNQKHQESNQSDDDW